MAIPPTARPRLSAPTPSGTPRASRPAVWCASASGCASDSAWCGSRFRFSRRRVVCSRMTLPGRIDTERQLESALAQPSDADVEVVSRLDGDVLILGAGGKMGPSLARRLQQAVGESGSRTRVWAASRFASGAVRASLESAGIETVACDLLDREQVAALPDCPYVLFLAGRKFGTSDRTDLTWITNTVVPASVAQRFCRSRMVVFSTGNVYPLVPSEGPPAAEDLLPSPV